MSKQKMLFAGASALALVAFLGSANAQRAKSHCVGLDEKVCGSTDGCRWFAVKKDGTPIKRKPHCRISKNKNTAGTALVPPVAKADTTEAQPKAEKKSWFSK